MGVYSYLFDSSLTGVIRFTHDFTEQRAGAVTGIEIAA